MNNNNERQSVPFRYSDAARLVVLAGIVIFAVMNLAGFLKVLTYLMGILAPVIIGIFLAFVLNLPMSLIERKILRGDSRLMKKIRRPVALLLSLLLLLGILTLVIVLVIPQSITAIQQISGQIPTYYQQLLDWVDRYNMNLPWLKEYILRFNVSSSDIGLNLFSNAGNMAGGLLKGVTGVLGGVVNGLLGISFAMFMLASKETLISQVDRIMQAYMNPQNRSRAKYYIAVVSQTFGKYISGQVVEAGVIGIITTVAMLLFGFPYATVIGPVTGLASLIPMIGAFIGGAVGFLLILTVNPMQALFFLLFITILQQLDGMFVYPRIVGSSVGLPPLWVFFAVTVGGALFGFVGTFLGVPALAVFYRLLRENVSRRIKLHEEGAVAKYQILKIPKGRAPIRINEPDLLDLADPEVDTTEFLEK